MAITLAVATENPINSLDPWVQTTPVAVEVGDVVMAVIFPRVFTVSSNLGAGGFSLNGASTATTSAWSPVMGYWSTVSGGHVQIHVAHAVVQTAGNVVVSVDTDGTSSGRMAVAVLRGAALTSTFPVVGSVTRATSTTPAAAAVAPEKAGDWVISVVAHVPQTATITASPGFANIVNFNSNLSASDRVGFRIESFTATGTAPIAGAPTVSTAVDWFAVNLVLSMKPEAILGKTISRGLYL